MAKECLMSGEVLSFLALSLYSQVIKDPSLFIDFLCHFKSFANKGYILSLFGFIRPNKSLSSIKHSATYVCSKRSFLGKEK